MNKIKRIVIVGATSSIAEHCARLWMVGDAVEMILIGRDEARLKRIGADLLVRNGASRVTTMLSGFLTVADIDSTVAIIFAAGPVDVVLIAHGMLPDQGACEASLPAVQDALAINGVSPVLFAEAFAQRMSRQQQGGSIALIGSVAGDRGRKSNYVYGAAKGLVDRYAEGMQHRFANTSLHVVLIKPGPTETPMTAHLENMRGKLAPVESVARDIVDGIGNAKPVIYTPGKWRLIMAVIRHLPRFVFNKMDI